MHSSELPVTEWWDPEFEIYDVPNSPYDPHPVGCSDLVTAAEFDVWWTAYEFLWDLRWVMHGSAEYRPDFRGRQLTTGRSYADGWADGMAGRDPRSDRLALGANRLNAYERGYVDSGRVGRG